MSVFVPLTVVVPLLVAVGIALLGGHLRRIFVDSAAVATAIGVTWLCVVLMLRSARSPVVYAFGGFPPHGGIALGILFVIDPLSAGLAALAGTLVTACFLFTWRYFDEVKSLFHVLVLVFLAAMVGFCLTGDLFDLFVFFELMGVTAFALTGYKVEERGPLLGALNFAIVNSVGAMLVLTGIGLLYARTGALNLAQIGQSLAAHPSSRLVVVAFVLITAGFFIKAAIAPFHFWQADAHAVAPAPVCAIFSGVMDELGLYALFRIYWTVFAGPFAPHIPELRAILFAFGVVTALLGAVMCALQQHLKRLLAFSTISHMGVFLLGAAFFNPLGLAGCAVYILAHAMVKGSLFLGTGILQHHFQTNDIGRLHGHGRRLPWTGLLIMLGGLGLASLPPFGTYLGKGLIESAASSADFPWLVVVLIISSVGTGGSVLRAAGSIFLGLGPVSHDDTMQGADEAHSRESSGSPGRTPFVMFVPALVLVLAALAFGVVPHLGFATEVAAARFEDRTAYVAASLGSGIVAPLPPPPLAPAAPDLSMLVTGFIAVGLAIALALLTFVWRKLPSSPRKQITQPIKGPLVALRRLQSGHPGDYVTWVLLGTVVLGIACALTLR